MTYLEKVASLIKVTAKCEIPLGFKDFVGAAIQEKIVLMTCPEDWGLEEKGKRLRDCSTLGGDTPCLECWQREYEEVEK